MLRTAPIGRSRLPAFELRIPTLILIMVFAAVEVAVVLVGGTGMSVRWLSVGLIIVQAVMLPLVPARPVIVGVAVVVLGAVLLGIGPPTTTGLAPAAVFTAAALHPDRRSWPAALAMLAVTPLALIRGSGTDALLAVAVAVAAWSLGTLVRSQRSRRAEALRSELRLHRSALARDVHDIVGHSLAMIIVQAGAAEDGFDNDPAAARSALRAIDASARAALGEVRGVVAGISRQHELADLDELVGTARTAGLAPQLRVTGDPSTVPEPIADAVFRVVRESITNTVRHSAARSVRIDIRCGAFSVDVLVADDGAMSTATGFTPGQGIGGMAELVQRLGGTLQCGPGRSGFVVRARLPLTVRR